MLQTTAKYGFDVATEHAEHNEMMRNTQSLLEKHHHRIEEGEYNESVMRKFSCLWRERSVSSLQVKCKTVQVWV
jgi:hypothetical protein